MLQIILIIIGISLVINLFIFLWECLEKLANIVIKVVSVIFVLLAIVLCWHFRKITIPVIVITLIVLYLYGKAENKKLSEERKLRIQKNKLWIEQHCSIVTNEQINQIFCDITIELKEKDTNSSSYKFTYENMPYGRANAFLNYFDTNIYQEEPYYFSVVPSEEDSEFREYGLMVTDKGVYVSGQYKNSSDSSYSVKNAMVPFTGLKSFDIYESSVELHYIRKDDYDDGKVKKFYCPKGFDKHEVFIKLYKSLIEENISSAYLKETVVDQEEIHHAVNRGAQNVEKHIQKEQVEFSSMASALKASAANYNAIYQETKNNMNGSQGHGYAAEYQNNTMDRLRGFDVESTAQILDENGRQNKNGADRTVNGTEIQTKYHKTASNSIGEAFEGGTARYIRSDGSGKMMQIEVPRDQYQQALELMQKRIDKGEVPNVEPGENAATYVKRGYFTYAQAMNAAKAGTIESLSIDVASGVICTSSAAGISAIIMFAHSIWNGEALEDAVKSSIQVGIKVLGRGTLIYTLTMQLSRKEMRLNPLVNKYMMDITNPVYSMSENLAYNINHSTIAKTQFGKALGLDVISGKTLISNSITAAVVFGPDIFKALNGRISIEQLIKNLGIGAGGIVGAGIGQALIPIPIIGGMIGGSIGGFIAKNVMDNFAEDDAKKMFRILKEEFINEVMLANLSEEEFSQVSRETIENEKLNVILQDMYASGEYRRYAREAIVRASIINVISNRNIITNELYEQGLLEILKESEAA